MLGLETRAQLRSPHSLPLTEQETSLWPLNICPSASEARSDIETNSQRNHSSFNFDTISFEANCGLQYRKLREVED